MYPVGQQHGVFSGGQHDHQAVKGLRTVRILTANHVSGMQSLPFLGTGVDAYLETGIFV